MITAIWSHLFKKNYLVTQYRYTPLHCWTFLLFCMFFQSWFGAIHTLQYCLYLKTLTCYLLWSQITLEYVQLTLMEIEESKGHMTCDPRMKELRNGNANRIFLNMLLEVKQMIEGVCRMWWKSLLPLFGILHNDFFFLLLFLYLC